MMVVQPSRGSHYFTSMPASTKRSPCTSVSNHIVNVSSIHRSSVLSSWSVIIIILCRFEAYEALESNDDKQPASGWNGCGRRGCRVCCSSQAGVVATALLAVGHSHSEAVHFGRRRQCCRRHIWSAGTLFCAIYNESLFSILSLCYRSQWSSGNCGARGPRFASRCGQKFVFGHGLHTDCSA